MLFVAEADVTGPETDAAERHIEAGRDHPHREALLASQTARLIFSDGSTNVCSHRDRTTRLHSGAPSPHGVAESTQPFHGCRGGSSPPGGIAGVGRLGLEPRTTGLTCRTGFHRPPARAPALRSGPSLHPRPDPGGWAAYGL